MEVPCYLLHLREAVGYLFELGAEDPATGVLLTTIDGLHKIRHSTTCHDEIEYHAVTYVHPDCLASHGVTTLEIGEARQCCCFVGHCDPIDYRCEPL